MAQSFMRPPSTQHGGCFPPPSDRPPTHTHSPTHPPNLLHLFTDFTNIFGTYIPPCFGLPPLPGFMTDQEFNSAVSSLALKFLYLAIGAACAGFLQQFCWTYTSVRQTNRLRRRYLAAVLRQDVSFFDTQVWVGARVSAAESLSDYYRAHRS